MSAINLLAIGFIVLMAVAGTRQSIALWRGKLVIGRAVVDKGVALHSKSSRDRFWWARLRCAPSATAAMWGAVIGSVILLKPSDCAGGSCNVVVVISAVGVAVLLGAGLLLFSVYLTNRPSFVVPPWLRGQLLAAGLIDHRTAALKADRMAALAGDISVKSLSGASPSPSCR